MSMSIEKNLGFKGNYLLNFNSEETAKDFKASIEAKARRCFKKINVSAQQKGRSLQVTTSDPQCSSDDINLFDQSLFHYKNSQTNTLNTRIKDEEINSTKAEILKTGLISKMLEIFNKLMTGLDEIHSVAQEDGSEINIIDIEA